MGPFSRLQQRRRIKVAFRKFAGADLLIDYAEWKRALDIDNDFLARRLFDAVDTDQTEFIDLGEFSTFVELITSNRRQRLEFIFRIYDLDDDGAISSPEIRKILEASVAEQSVTLEEDVLKALVKQFMDRADIDKDKRICMEEFVEFVEGYPGIEDRFSAYAADWLNTRKRSNAAGPPARFGLRLRRAWESRRREWIWSFGYVAANAGLFNYTMQQHIDAGIWVQIARGAGACLNLNAALILLPQCKLLWTWVRRMPFERYFPLDHAISIHKAIGMIIATFAMFHIGSHLYSDMQAGQSVVHALLYTSVGISGLVATAAIVALAWFGTRVRRRRYETFVLSHHLYSVFLVALLLHGPTSWMWLSIPLLIFMADGAVRFFWNTHQVEVVEIKPLANGVTRIQLKKPKKFHFEPGDYVRLNIPELSRMQWHPFTISAAPEAAVMDVHVRNNGDWTGALHNLSRNKALTTRRWNMRIDGPYGAPSSRLFQARVAVLVAASIGVTPFASILHSLVLRHRRARQERKGSNQVIHFHWLNRSQLSYEWFKELLDEAEEVLGPDQFKLHIHLTSLSHDLTNIAMQIAMDSYHERRQRDPITGLNAETSPGRPDWDVVFQQLALVHPREVVEVFFCGPPELGSDIKRKCRHHGFIYHEEKF